MTTHKDYLGTDIQVGDVVVYSDGKYADLNTGMVTKRNPILLQVNGSGSVSPSQCMVITKKYKTEFNPKYLTLLNKFQPMFKKDARAPRAVKRYTLHLMEHINSDYISVVVNVLVNGKNDKLVKDLGNFKTYGNSMIVRMSDGKWRSGVTDQLTITNDYRHRKYVELPAKLLQKYFGNVPDKAEVVADFDHMEACKDYLKSVGVSV